MMLIFILSQKRHKKHKNGMERFKACIIFCAFCAFLWLTLLQKLTGDNELLDFGGALVDAQGADVAIEAFDDGSTDQAGAAVNLNGAVDDSAGSFGGKQLGFASLRE